MGIYLYPTTTLVVADCAPLTAISYGYAISHTTSLRLSAKNDACALVFCGIGLREKRVG